MDCTTANGSEKLDLMNVETALRPRPLKKIGSKGLVLNITLIYRCG